jgi:hypothetical protein
MKRWLLATSAMIIVVFLVISLRFAIKEEGEKKREVAYQTALQVYSENLKPGLTRKDIESYLQAGNVTFDRMCCVEERSTFADLIKVGQEDAPWYCIDEYVYIAFEFTATEAHSLRSPIYDSDVLRIQIYRQPVGCL